MTSPEPQRFPLVHESSGPLSMHRLAGPAAPVVEDLSHLDLNGPSGVVFGMDSPDLNVNLVVVEEGEELERHRNSELDVLIIVVAGKGELDIDGQVSPLSADVIALVPKGSERRMQATTRLVFYSIHRRRHA